MTARTLPLLLALLMGLAIIGTAQGAEAFNLMVSDQDTGLLEGFTEVRIYAVDPVTELRLTIEPSVVLDRLSNPILLTLDPGRYEFVVWMFYLPFEVPYFQFDITEGEKNLINLLLFKRPKELVTY
jgi:hypothetical protein